MFVHETKVVLNIKQPHFSERPVKGRFCRFVRKRGKECMFLNCCPTRAREPQKNCHSYQGKNSSSNNLFHKKINKLKLTSLNHKLSKKEISKEK